MDRARRYDTADHPQVGARSEEVPYRGYPVGRVSQQASIARWGWLPVISVVSAYGLLVVSYANTGARSESTWAEPLFWLGLILIFLPVASRISSPRSTRTEIIGLLVMLGFYLYIVKILHSPQAFTQHDEFYHFRTTIDILKNGRLFTHNPLLPVSAHYPGMETVTAALAGLTGYSIFPIGSFVIAVGRIILTLALYLFFERISGSERVAGLATLIYMTNPNYLYFLSMFKYQSLALAFVALVLYATARQEQAPLKRWRGWFFVTLLGVSFAVITHHIASFALAGLLTLWSIVAVVRSRGKEGFLVPGRIAMIALIATLAWLLLVATTTIDYLRPHILGAGGDLVRMMEGEAEASRILFNLSREPEAEAHLAPRWERVTAYSSVILILAGLLFGFVHIWRSYRNSAIILTLALTTMLYPASLLLRLTNRGWEIANRSSEFVFIAIGLVAAIGVVRTKFPGRLNASKPGFVAICLLVVFMGGIIAGWPPLWRQPGPYIPASGTRAVESQGLATADWAQSYLGPGNKFGADKLNSQLLATYGGQDISKTISGGVEVDWILYAPGITSKQVESLTKGDIRYLLVDERTFTVSRVNRFYPGASATQAREKFDQTERINRIFDSGDMIIYDVGALRDEP